jgi:hypothetical protein
MTLSNLPLFKILSLASRSVISVIPARRFPAPWSVDDLDTCFAVRDHNGQALAYVYFEDEPGRRSAAKLPEVLRK